MNQVVIIPALNPDGRILHLVTELRKEGFSRFIVVDPGSSAEHAHLFDILERRGAVVLHHPNNLGKGSALKTALCRVRGLFPDAEAAVTCDADGQHLPRDIARVCKQAEAHPGSLVLGTRDFSCSNVPPRSRIGNSFSSLYFKLDTGLACPDTQTGLRCIPATLFATAMTTPGARYDFEMNFLTRVAKAGEDIRYVPIQTVYEGNNEVSHFRPIADSALIYRQFIRFGASSLGCSVVDLALFALVLALIGVQGASAVAAATVIARLSSGLLNFLLNRNWSFSAKTTRHSLARIQALRYFALYLATMASSFTLVSMLSFAPVPLVGVKMFVDSCLFVVSYAVQKKWVFRERAIGAGAKHAQLPAASTLPQQGV